MNELSLTDFLFSVSWKNEWELVVEVPDWKEKYGAENGFLLFSNSVTLVYEVKVIEVQ